MHTQIEVHAKCSFIHGHDTTDTCSYYVMIKPNFLIIVVVVVSRKVLANQVTSLVQQL